LTKHEAGLLWGMMKIAFEGSQEKRYPQSNNKFPEQLFPMSNEALMKLLPVWEKIAKDLDSLNGIKSHETMFSV
jgi:hypothetical protein